MMIGTGELFCRWNIGDDGQDLELCGKVIHSECIRNALPTHSNTKIETKSHWQPSKPCEDSTRRSNGEH